MQELKGELSKKDASLWYQRGERIRVDDGTTSKIVQIDKTKALTLHDGIIAVGFSPFGLNGSGRTTMRYWMDDKILESDRKKRIKR